ncbi:MAG: HIT family protein [Sciscionella sp.]
MTKLSWDAIARGDGCPYDQPRPANTEYFDLIAPLAVSSLCLTANQAYRGSCALIFDARHATRIDELSADEWGAYTRDLYQAHCAIVRVCRPDHVNVALLGNTIPHLHWGIIPRYRSDPRWGHSIWMTSRVEMADVRLSPTARAELITSLQRELRA